MSDDFGLTEQEKVFREERANIQAANQVKAKARVRIVELRNKAFDIVTFDKQAVPDEMIAEVKSLKELINAEPRNVPELAAKIPSLNS